MKEKKIGRIVSFALVGFIIILFQWKSVSAEGTDGATPRTLTSGEYQYEVLNDGTVSITKYSGTSSVVRIPEMIDGKKVTVIGERAFEQNQYINTVYFSKNIKEIMMGAFEECSNLHYVYLNLGLKGFGNGCFGHCDLYTIKIPATVTDMKGFEFYNNGNLKQVEVEEGISKLGYEMFFLCEKLEYIEIGNSVQKLESGVLDTCVSFKGFVTQKIPKYESEFLVIPSQIRHLGYDIFRNCKKTGKIVILNKNPYVSLESIPQNTIIYGYKNTMAEEYAKDYGNKFVEFIQTEQITISQSKLKLQLGVKGTERLNITYAPNNTTIREVVWSSSNPQIATVDKFGNVRGISNGMAIISARTFDESNLKQECTVTVTTPIQDISLDKKKLYLDLSNKKSEYIKIVPSPSGAEIDTISWKSSNTKVVTVNSNGEVKAKGIGTAKVTATVNGKSKTCTVYVAPQKVEKLKVSSAKSDSVTLSWSKVKGASGYRIYVYSEKSKRYVVLKDCSARASFYNVKKVDGKQLTSATLYKFKVYPYVILDNKKVKGSYSSIAANTRPKRTNIQSLKRINNKKSIKLNWVKISKVNYYEVWISNYKNKGYKCVKKTKGNYYTIKSLARNKKYYIKVRGVGYVNGKKVKAEFSPSRNC